MAKAKKQTTANNTSIDIDLNMVDQEEIESKKTIENIDILMAQKRERDMNVEPFNPLKNETVIVRYLPDNSFPDPRHPFHGGISEKAVYEFCVPSLENGTLKNPLSNAEKVFFEDILGIKVMIMYDRDDETKMPHKSFNKWIKTTNCFLENDIDLEDKLGYKAPKNQYMKPQMLIENYLDNKIDINKINNLKISVENEYKKMT